MNTVGSGRPAPSDGLRVSYPTQPRVNDGQRPVANVSAANHNPFTAVPPSSAMEGEVADGGAQLRTNGPNPSIVIVNKVSLRFNDDESEGSYRAWQFRLSYVPSMALLISIEVGIAFACTSSPNPQQLMALPFVGSIIIGRR